MKHVLLKKKIVIVMGKLTRSRVLQGGAGLRGALRDRNEVKQDKIMRDGSEDPIIRPPYPIAIPMPN